jgi:hypothetical protein
MLEENMCLFFGVGFGHKMVLFVREDIKILEMITSNKLSSIS